MSRAVTCPALTIAVLIIAAHVCASMPPFPAQADKQRTLEQYLDTHVAVLVCDLTSKPSLAKLAALAAVFRQTNAHLEDSIYYILVVNKAESSQRARQELVPADVTAFCRQIPIHRVIETSAAQDTNVAALTKIVAEAGAAVDHARRGGLRSKRVG